MFETRTFEVDLTPFRGAPATKQTINQIKAYLTQKLREVDMLDYYTVDVWAENDVLSYQFIPIQPYGPAIKTLK